MIPNDFSYFKNLSLSKYYLIESPFYFFLSLVWYFVFELVDLDEIKLLLKDYWSLFVLIVYYRFWGSVSLFVAEIEVF
jgi:hypothetical protein